MRDGVFQRVTVTSQKLKYILAVLGSTCCFFFRYLLPWICFVVESRIRVYQWFLNDLDLFFWWLFTDCIKGFIAMNNHHLGQYLWQLFPSIWKASPRQLWNFTITWEWISRVFLSNKVLSNKPRYSIYDIFLSSWKGINVGKYTISIECTCTWGK